MIYRTTNQYILYYYYKITLYGNTLNESPEMEKKKNPFSCILAFIDFKNGQTEKESSYNAVFIIFHSFDFDFKSYVFVNNL